MPLFGLFQSKAEADISTEKRQTNTYNHPTVFSTSSSATHSFSKPPVSSIPLIANLGVQSDAHAGPTDQHRSRLHIKPPPPNLRQVHLMMKETLDQVSSAVSPDQPPLQPGDIGENITTVGVDLLKLGRGTKLRFVSDEEDDSHPGATIVITGLRNPCIQIDKFRSGLKEKFIIRDESRNIVGRLAGVMATVEVGGEVRPGMRIVIEEPAEYLPLEVV